jgi:hypothetical protein
MAYFFMIITPVIYADEVVDCHLMVTGSNTERSILLTSRLTSVGCTYVKYWVCCSVKLGFCFNEVTTKSYLEFRVSTTGYSGIVEVRTGVYLVMKSFVKSFRSSRSNFDTCILLFYFDFTSLFFTVGSIF